MKTNIQLPRPILAGLQAARKSAIDFPGMCLLIDPEQDPQAMCYVDEDAEKQADDDPSKIRDSYG